MKSQNKFNLSKEFLYQKYTVEGLTSIEISKQTQFADRTIRKYLKIYQLSRSPSEAQNPICQTLTKEQIEKTYKENGYRLRGCSKALGIGIKAFKGQLKKHNIQFVSPKSPLKGKKFPNMSGVNHWTHKRNGGKRPEVSGKNHWSFGKSMSKETKEKISKTLYGRFRGAENPSWKGGKKNFKEQIRSSTLYKQWRTSIFERDNFTCQICGIRGGILNADHIKPFSHILNENNISTLAEAEACKPLWNLENGRTLCKPCHEKTPTFAGKSRIK